MPSRQFFVEGQKLDIVVRPMGALGWTWVFCWEGCEEIRNTGRLEAGQEQAFDCALSAALDSLRRVRACLDSMR